MIERRDFLKCSTAAVAALALGIGRRAEASQGAVFNGIIYTKDNQGQWNGKAGSHAPEVSLDGARIMVKTKHPMTDAHFIVRHSVVLENGTVVGAKTFTPKDKPESSFELPAGYKGKVYTTSFCNKHDFWMTETVA